MTHTYEKDTKYYYRGKVGGTIADPVILSFDIAIDYNNHWLSIRELLEPYDIDRARKDFLKLYLQEIQCGSNPDDEYDSWKAESREA